MRFGSVWRLQPTFRIALAALLVVASSAAAQTGGAPAADRLEGHGGPIKGLAVSAAGDQVLTASFDYALGLWEVSDQAAERRAWLDGHEAAANTALFLADGRIVSGGDDTDLRVWDPDTGETRAVLTGHTAKVLSLAGAGSLVASASWDARVGLWDFSTGDAPTPIFLEGHRSGVNDVAFAVGGEELFSASTDGTIRRWRVADGALIRVEARHGFGINLLALDETAGWLAYGAADGVVRVLDLASGDEIALFDAGRRPILAMAVSPNRDRLAYGDGEGYISVVSTRRWALERDFHAVLRGPVWALAFLDDARLLAAGLDDFAAIWPMDAASGPIFDEDAPRRFHVEPETVSNGERQFARKCSVCHTLSPDGRRRAGPTLFGVFGRAAGGLEGYPYSDALRGTEIVWSDETLDKLFDIGPDYYTPGSKMPMQRIVDPADRADLIAYLRLATGAEPSVQEVPQ